MRSSKEQSLHINIFATKTSVYFFCPETDRVFLCPCHWFYSVKVFAVPNHLQYMLIAPTRPSLMAHSHCTGPGQETKQGRGKGLMDSNILSKILTLVQERDRDQDPLCPIVSVPFLVPP